MTRSDRVFVRNILLEAGYPEDWVSAKSGPISGTYYHHRRPGPPAPKDDKGMAIYGPEDVAGLLEVARDLKDGNGAAWSVPRHRSATTRSVRCGASSTAPLRRLIL